MIEIDFEQKEALSKKILSILNGLNIEDASMVLTITAQSLSKNSCVKVEEVQQ